MMKEYLRVSHSSCKRGDKATLRPLRTGARPALLSVALHVQLCGVCLLPRCCCYCGTEILQVFTGSHE